MKYVLTFFICSLSLLDLKAQDIKTVQVKKNLYMVGDRSYSCFYITETGVVVIDPLDARHASATMEAIKKVTDLPVTHVFYSHNHWDHISGSEIFKDQGATIYSHLEAKKSIPPNDAVILPDSTWSGEKTAYVIGGKTLELFYYGQNHGDGMTVFRFPEHETILIVDLVVPDRVLYAYLPDAKPQKWVESLRKIQKLEFETVLMSHVRPVGDRKDITFVQNYFEALYTAVQEEIDNGTNLFEIPNKVKLPQYESWSNYEQWLPMNAWRILMEKSIGQ